MDLRINDGSIAFAPKHNRPGKGDAREFQSQAKQWCKFFNLDPDERLVIFDNSKSKAHMRDTVLEALERLPLSGLDPVVTAFFCHGYKRGLQPGFDLGHVDRLAKAISYRGGKNVIVPLYACDTARDLDRDRADDLEEFGGDGGFADELRDALCRAGSVFAKVDAHTTAGHTTRNWNLRRFKGDGSSVGGKGGFYIVPIVRDEKSEKHVIWLKWREQMKTDFRWMFPLMTTTEIHHYLAAL